MAEAFQPTAFQNNAFQVDSTVTPVAVGAYRHSAPAPIKKGRGERLSTLERRFKRMERQP